MPVSYKFYKYQTVYKKLKIHLDSTLPYKLRTFSKISVSRFLKMNFLKCGDPAVYVIFAFTFDCYFGMGLILYNFSIIIANVVLFYWFLIPGSFVNFSVCYYLMFLENIRNYDILVFIVEVLRLVFLLLKLIIMLLLTELEVHARKYLF